MNCRKCKAEGKKIAKVFVYYDRGLSDNKKARKIVSVRNILTEKRQ